MQVVSYAWHYAVHSSWWPAYVLRLVKGEETKKNQLKSELRPPATSDWIDEWKGWLIRRWGEAHHCICDDETPPFPSWCSSYYIISAGRAPTIARCRVRESQSAELEINSSLSSPRPSLAISMDARPSASFDLLPYLCCLCFPWLPDYTPNPVPFASSRLETPSFSPFVSPPHVQQQCHANVSHDKFLSFLESFDAGTSFMMNSCVGYIDRHSDHHENAGFWRVRSTSYLSIKTVQEEL